MRHKSFGSMQCPIARSLEQVSSDLWGHRGDGARLLGRSPCAASAASARRALSHPCCGQSLYDGLAVIIRVCLVSLLSALLVGSADSFWLNRRQS